METSDFFNEVFSAAARLVYEAFKAGTKKRAGSSRGKVSDYLGFFENASRVFGHFFRRQYACSSGINEFFVVPKKQAATTNAFLDQAFFFREEVGFANCKAHRYAMLKELAIKSAMRATKGGKSK